MNAPSKAYLKMEAQMWVEVRNEKVTEDKMEDRKNKKNKRKDKSRGKRIISR